MLSKLRSELRSPSPAFVLAALALFVALGGTSIAAVTLKRNAVKNRHIAKNAVTAPKVKNASLLSEDFAPGQLPTGEKGDPGAQGERGPQGPGATRISYSAPAGNSLTVVEVATVGPWKLYARCTAPGVQSSGTALDVQVNGPPGTLEWAGMESVDDGAPATPKTGGIGLSAGNNPLASADAEATHYDRLAYDMQLESSSTTATLSINGVANNTGPGARGCTLRGTAVPAS
jgi:hypothetical protein